MEKKYKILIGAILGFIVLAIILGSLKKDEPFDVQAGKYIKTQGFTYDEESDIYTKLLSDLSLEKYFEEVNVGSNSEYKELFFDNHKYQMNEILYKYDEGVEHSLNATYNYKDKTTDYSYTLNYNKSSFMVKGTYNDLFTCDVEYYENTDMTKDELCKIAKDEVIAFKLDAKKSFSNYTLLKQIQQ